VDQGGPCFSWLRIWDRRNFAIQNIGTNCVAGWYPGLGELFIELIDLPDRRIFPQIAPFEIREGYARVLGYRKFIAYTSADEYSARERQVIRELSGI
jgi:hypothetical protein